MNNNDRPAKKFLAQYFHDGAWWSMKISAYDFEDAEIRCKKLNLQLDGEFVMSIPAVGSGGWLPRAVCWIRNRMRSA